MQNREMRWRTPRKRGQRHSSLHVSRRQPKTKISSLRRPRGNRTRKRSNHLIKRMGRAKAQRTLEPQAQPGRETNRGTKTNITFRVPEREREKLRTRPEKSVNIT